MFDESAEFQRADHLLFTAAAQLAALLDASDMPLRPELAERCREVGLSLMELRQRLADAAPPADEMPWLTRREHTAVAQQRRALVGELLALREEVRVLLDGELFPDERYMVAVACGGLSVTAVVLGRLA